MHIITAIALVCALGLAATPARAAPDVDGALAALVDGPLNATGDLIGAAGFMTAGVTGLLGDGVALVDDNRYTGFVLRGFASGLVHRLAMLVSWTATGALEGLRGEDVERLPEAQAAYLKAAPGVGRFDTVFSGVQAVELAIEDALLNPLLFALYATGANDTGDRVAGRLEDSRDRALGPTAK